jgi:hypothetical protein
VVAPVGGVRSRNHTWKFRKDKPLDAGRLDPCRSSSERNALAPWVGASGPAATCWVEIATHARRARCGARRALWSRIARGWCGPRAIDRFKGFSLEPLARQRLGKPRRGTATRTSGPARSSAPAYGEVSPTARRPVRHDGREPRRQARSRGRRERNGSRDHCRDPGGAPREKPGGYGRGGGRASGEHDASCRRRARRSARGGRRGTTPYGVADWNPCARSARARGLPRTRVVGRREETPMRNRSDRRFHSESQPEGTVFVHIRREAVTHSPGFVRAWWMQGRSRLAHRVAVSDDLYPREPWERGYVAERPRAGCGLAWWLRWIGRSWRAGC